MSSFRDDPMKISGCIVFPADAGMILLKCGFEDVTRSVPRGCGDDPSYAGPA